VSTGPEQAEATTSRLSGVLEQEFDALKRRDLAQLERLGESREALLSQLLYLKQTHQDQWRQLPFEAARRALAHCQTLHKRNEMLLTKQLEAVRQALGAIQKSSDDADLYTRLGKLAQRRAYLFRDDA